MTVLDFLGALLRFRLFPRRRIRGFPNVSPEFLQGREHGPDDRQRIRQDGLLRTARLAEKAEKPQDGKAEDKTAQREVFSLLFFDLLVGFGVAVWALRRIDWDGRAAMRAGARFFSRHCFSPEKVHRS